MEISYKNLIDRVFDDFKKLPYYSVERRIDTIFSFFIGELLTKNICKDGEGKIELVAQEFPIKHDYDKNRKEDNRANCLDYLCTDRTNNRIYYVELKTDAKSWNIKQLKFYKENDQWIDVVEKLKIKIKRTTGYANKLKYLNLFEVLRKYDLIKYSTEEYAKILIKKIQNETVIINDHIEDLLKLIIVPEIEIKIICIGPPSTHNIPEYVKSITFDELDDLKDSPFQRDWEMLKNKLKNCD